jgi:hypothetical protein
VVVQSQQVSDVLVVLPATTWQGRNPVDDDGDGRADTLGAGLPIDLGRPYAGDGLPPQVRRHEALLLARLDRAGRRYDVTTDIALARGIGPGLAGHRGVILAGDAVWLDPAVARRLRRYVRGGGRLLSVGTGSLRRSVTFTPGGRAIDPTPATTRDLFGARLRPLARVPGTTLVNTQDDIDLFAGTEGQFTGIGAFEETAAIEGSGQPVATAATADGQRTVIVAARVGRGLVIRPGLPDFSARLGRDAELSTLLERTWTLLRTR